MPDKFVAFSGTGHKLGGRGHGNDSPTGRAHNERQARSLYKPPNVTGYTGKIGKQPTVYYSSGNVFGHITQAHGTPENVGREMPIESSGYTALNTGDKGQLQERNHGRLFHESRNPLINANTTSEPSLANAHRTFPDLKPMTDPQVYQQVMARRAAAKLAKSKK